MDAVLDREFGLKLYSVVSNLKIANIEKVLSEMFEVKGDSPAVKYIGELNKNDLMF